MDTGILDQFLDTSFRILQKACLVIFGYQYRKLGIRPILISVSANSPVVGEFVETGFRILA
jgi:hypothetical protein